MEHASEERLPTFGHDERQTQLIKASDLNIVWAEDPRYWTWETWDGVTVARLGGVWWFYVTGTLSIDKLEKGAGYGAYLLFRLHDQHQNLSEVKARVRFANEIMEETEREGFTIYLSKEKESESERGIFPQRRGDGWIMEVKIGEFFYDASNDDYDLVDIRVIEISSSLKSGVSIVGMEVRQLTYNGLHCINQQVVRRHFIQVRDLKIIWSNNKRYWEWETANKVERRSDDDFFEVAKLEAVRWFDIRGRISTKKLEKNTFYGAYLVFRMEENAEKLEEVKARVKFVKDIPEGKDKDDEGFTLYLGRKQESGKKGVFASVYGQKISGSDDVWMELKIGELFYDGKRNDVVDARVYSHTKYQKKFMWIAGIELRPLK